MPLIKLAGSIALWLLVATAEAACPALLSHTFNSLVGDKPVDLCQYTGKTILVVNTASQCGYTPQYAGLEQLYRKYRARGLVVLGFPANDFGRQEPGTNVEVARFCEENYGVTFPMFEKAAGDRPLKVNPLYAGLISATGRAPQWNFHKYLIDRLGRVRSFESAVEPRNPELIRAVEAALGG
jgi:glutathione peroxidase